MFIVRRFSALLLSVVLVIPVAAYADMFGPSHTCMQPHKPYEFTSEAQVQRFRSEVEMYEMCMDSFIEEQRDAAAVHQDAAEQAISEWNRFVDFELR